MLQKSEQKRLQILKAAGELFCQQGYQASMDDIAKHADVSKQTIYSHFKTKEQLFETCIQYRCEQRAIDESAFDVNLPINVMLVEFGVRFQNMHLEEAVLQTFRNAVGQVKIHSNISASYLKAGPEKTLIALSNYLQHHHDHNNIQLKASADNSAMQLLLMFHGKAAYWAFLGGDSKESNMERKQYIEQCVSMFLTANRFEY
ncbi:TetR/AcrR family transcriptional regulator [Vibrio mediterranei]|uniref:TetR/AcrR family transcriptional regulator n=1 Tax=Vibrio mediterranei TaxID=689 RepID=UPI002284A274|nr:TetR/AcrR family transcriptional regulator [Vibrio mediterranei]MCY9852453.1 TetR/AcrR family transcriptional regulator [Vibrio mediterranei]